MESSVTDHATADCLHCGTTFRVTPQRAEYCCAGCEFVRALITRNELDRFYNFRDRSMAPITPLVFQKRDFAWLADLTEAAEADSKAEARLILDLQGISCIGCVWLIEKLWQRLPGAIAGRADPAMGQLELRWRPGALDLTEFAREIQSFGYLVGPPSRESAPPSRALRLRIGLCGAFALNTMLFTLPGYLGMERSFEFAALFERLALAFSTLSFLVGGSYFISRTWRSLRNGVLHIDLPISLGLIAAYTGSVYAWWVGESRMAYLDFVSVFVFLMLAGRWLQHRSIERNRHRLLGLQSEPPPVLLSGGEKRSAATLVAGTKYRIGSGQHVPVRSKLISPGATFGMEWINGESDAHSAPAGGLISSGAMNLGGQAVELEATERWAESMLARLIERAPTAPAGDRNFEHFLRGYILAVSGLALFGAAAWMVAGATLPFALQVLVSVLVVSCPCALGVALPMADELATSRLGRLGLFVRDATLWSRLGRVRKIIFDKTGTLTLETMALRNPEALLALPFDQRRLLARMVQDNLHPVSCCLRETLMAAGVEPIDEEILIQETTGFGLEARTAGGIWRLGRPDWHAGAGSEGDCLFSRDGQPLAAFSIVEEIRADAVEEVTALGRLGYHVHILSGDRAAKVAAMATRLGLSPARCRGEMSPQDKADWLREIGSRDTLMIGDGANDSLAFNESLCRGTPAIDRGLLEQKADFYFLGRGLSGIRELLATADRRAATVRRVIAFALVYNAWAIGLCLAGSMNPLAAAILMPLSSIVSLGIVFLDAPASRAR